MNVYGAIARRHYQQFRPKAYGQIEDPETHFHQLGEEVEAQIRTLELEIAGTPPAGETYLQRVGRLNMARQNAESDVLREMVLVPPEDEEAEEMEDPLPVEE